MPRYVGADVALGMENRLDGGSGNDTLTGTIASDTAGQNLLSGGYGRDSLTAIGGVNNVLDGGGGADLLTGSANDDLLLGGAGADTFACDVSVAQGTDTLGDFDGARDILRFAGLTDAGAAGLADDLDLITTVSDLGAGMDVVALFDSGSELIFEGLGTGSVTSIAQLVDDPLTQIA